MSPYAITYNGKSVDVAKAWETRNNGEKKIGEIQVHRENVEQRDVLKIRLGKEQNW